MSYSLRKLFPVRGSVEIIEFDAKSDTFIVIRSASTTNRSCDILHKLDSQNRVIFTKEFKSVAFLKFDSQNKAYIFEQISDFKRCVWVMGPNLTISTWFEYAASTNMAAFFDSEDNLFADSITGIGVMLANTDALNLIPRLHDYHFIRDDSFDAIPDGTVFLGLRREEPCKDASVILMKSEKTKVDPRPYFINVDHFGRIHAQRHTGRSLYLGQEQGIIRYNLSDKTVLSTRAGEKMENGFVRSLTGHYELYLAQNRIFAKFVENNICHVSELSDKQFTLEDDHYFILEETDYLSENRHYCYDFSAYWVKTFNLRETESYKVFQTSDKTGNAYFASSGNGGEVFKFGIKENKGDYPYAAEPYPKTVILPNSLYIFGLTTTDNGDLWILAQDLYVCPYGKYEAMKVTGMPYAAEPWQFKGKPGTNDVFIGSDDGIYIASLTL